MDRSIPSESLVKMWLYGKVVIDAPEYEFLE